MRTRGSFHSELLVGLALLASGCSARLTAPPSEWTWMSGSDGYDAPPAYGTQGVAAAGNTPGARSSAMGWISAVIDPEAALNEITASPAIRRFTCNDQ
jgi:hypothetical protein